MAESSPLERLFPLVLKNDENEIELVKTMVEDWYKAVIEVATDTSFALESSVP